MTAPASDAPAPAAAAAAADPRFDESYFREVYNCDHLRRFGMHWWSNRFYTCLADRCLRRIGGRRLLEFGCGHGFSLARLEKKYETFGFDVSEYVVSVAAKRAPGSTCLVADAQQPLPAALEPGTFDLVLAKYVFEHLPEPDAAMRSAAAMLRPGGVLFFSVPNTESLGARWKGPQWHAHLDPTHCSLLAPDRWREIVRDAGLEIRRETSDGWWDLPYVRWLPTWAQFPIFIGPSALTCIAGRALLPRQCGENLLIFAERPRE